MYNMVNEQLQEITQTLEKLTRQRSDLFDDETKAETLNQVLILLELAHQQAEQIELDKQSLAAYQAQVQGLRTRLARRPRRLSLNEGETSMVGGMISPRRGSSRSDYD